MAAPSLFRSRRPPPKEASPDSDSDDASSSSGSRPSVDYDEEEINARISPYWCSYRALIESHGFRLDTCKDVKQWYHEYWAAQASEGRAVTRDLPGYIRACRSPDEDELCQDAGLVSCPHSPGGRVPLTSLTTARPPLPGNAMLDGAQGRDQGRSYR